MTRWMRAGALFQFYCTGIILAQRVSARPAWRQKEGLMCRLWPRRGKH